MELRNNVCGGMALVNMLWVAINFMFQYKKPTVIDIPLSVSTNIYIHVFNLLMCLVFCRINLRKQWSDYSYGARFTGC